MNADNSSNEPLPALAVYNPALLKKEDLIAQFVARRPLLDRLVEDLRRSGGKGGYQHHLIIGPRGSGKTTLLRRLRYAIEDDPELAARWVPLVFPEEQYNVSRLSDLWVNCLDAVSDLLDRQNHETEAEALDDQIEKLPADEKRRAQAALDLLIGWAKKEKRALVLLFDNSDLIFDRLKDDHWAIREVLSADNYLLFIGASSAPIEATYDHKAAFYDFFKIHEMRGLNDAETREVLLTLARLRKTPRVIDLLERDPGRIRSLNLLTGGNLRTIIVLYQVLAQGTDDSVRTDLEQLLDQYTPLYKHRFESLSPQLQQIVDALALNWDPTSAVVLAEKLRLETNVVSAGLNRLANDGVVEKTPSPPGEKMFFQIAERFFNIWYLMRASRRVRRKLLWLVEFLKMFYGTIGLNRRARQLIQRAPKPGRNQSHRAELALAYARAVKNPALRRALETEGIRSLMTGTDGGRHSFKAMFDLDGEDASLKDIVDRFQTLDALSRKFEQTKGNLSAELWDYLIAAPSMSLEEKKKTAEEITKLGSEECKPWIEKFTAEAEELTEKFGAEACRELFEAIRNGLMADGADVEGADAAAFKWNDASLKVIARLAKFEQTKDKSLLDDIERILPQIQSPYLWLSWAETIADSDNSQEKLNQIYERIITLEGHDARTWHRVGKLLKYNLKRYEEAELAYRKSIELNPGAADPWNGFGHLLAEFLNRFDEAETAYRKSIELAPNDADNWNDLGHLLAYHLNRYSDAEEAYRKAIELDPKEAFYWNTLGALLADHLSRYDEAEEAYRKAIELDPKKDWLWNNLGRLFHYALKARFDEAEEAYRKAIELDPKEVVYWNNLGNLLKDNLGRYGEAEEAYRKAIELDPKKAVYWDNLGNLLADHLSRYGEAEEAYRKAIELCSEGGFHWNALGNLLKDHLNRYGEAEEAYRKAIELDPKEALLWNNLGWLFHYDQKGKFDEAEEAYRKAIELDPKEAAYWNNLGNLLADHLSRYGEAEEAYRKAIELDPKEAVYWNDLGNLLADHLKRFDEADEALKKAIEITPDEAEYHNSLAWQLYLQNKDLDEAETHSRRSLALEPDEINCIHTLACILAKQGRWDEALPFARRFIHEGNDEFHEEGWPEIIMFFRDAVTTGHSSQAVELLDETEYGERWRPLREALQAIAEDDSSYLLRVAPEVRQPAEEIVAMLLPEGIKLGTSPKPARARQTRRKRSLS